MLQSTGASHRLYLMICTLLGQVLLKSDARLQAFHSTPLGELKLEKRNRPSLSRMGVIISSSMPDLQLSQTVV
jgi:hypothetical protein